MNDKFCSNCGWKISGFKAIKTKNEVKKGIKQKKI